MKSNFSLVTAILLVFSLLLNGCKPSGASEALAPGVTDSTIVIGGFGPLTGPAALWGGILQGMDAYFKSVNETGGINGRQIKYIIKDDAYDPSKTVPAVRELIQKDQIFTLLGMIGTANNLAVRDFVRENGVPMVFPLTGYHGLFFPPEPSVFGVLPLYFDESTITANYAVDSLKFKKIAVFYQNDDFGKSGLIGVETALKKKGIDLVAKISVELTDTDLSSHAARLQQSGAEAVLLWCGPRQAAILLGASAVAGFKPQWMASTVLSDMSLMYDITKGAWANAIFIYPAKMPYDSTDATINRYRSAVAKYYPDLRWGAFPYSGCIYADMAVQALKAAGPNLTRESFIQALENLKPETSLFEMTPYGPGNRSATRSMALVRCLGATQYQNLTGFIKSDADIEGLAKEL